MKVNVEQPKWVCVHIASFQTFGVFFIVSAMSEASQGCWDRNERAKEIWNDVRWFRSERDFEFTAKPRKLTAVDVIFATSLKLDSISIAALKAQASCDEIWEISTWDLPICIISKIWGFLVKFFVDLFSFFFLLQKKCSFYWFV